MSKVELKKGAWSGDEDKILVAYIQQHGHGGCWRTLPKKAGLERSGNSCRLRWTNYLRPDIKRGKFSNYEEKSIIRLHALFGNKWSAIAAYLPNRSDHEIKNYWDTRLRKRLARMGIDPSTHKPKNNQPPGIAHMAQWEAARLQAEARQSSKHYPCLDVLKDTRTNLESPTCTLNSINPTITELIENNTLVSTNNYGTGQVEHWYTELMKGKMESNYYDHDVCGATMIGSNNITIIHDSINDNLQVGSEYNYWKDLLDFVNLVGPE